MASLFKPHNFAYQLPGGNYRTADGARVTKATPGAVKVDLGESPVWWGKYKGADGRFRKVPLCADKTASKQILAKMVADAKLAEHGMGDRFAEHRKRPLAEHLADYRRFLTAKGNTAKHVRLTCRRIEGALAGCGFVWIADLDGPKAATFLHEMNRAPQRQIVHPGQASFTKRELAGALGVRPGSLSKLLTRYGLKGEGNGKARRFPRSVLEALAGRCGRGAGIATSNHYLTAIKGFTRWLVRSGRMPSDPLGLLARRNAQADVRRERGALVESELHRLLTAALQSATVQQELAGPQRAMLYALAMGSGFRASELASLTPRSFALDTDPPTVTVDAAYSKRRRRDVQPIPPNLATALRDYLRGLPTDSPVWPGAWPGRAADMLRFDLEAAGIPWEDAEGRVIDFHALRHSYVTLLVKGGVNPKLAQELARHSDIRLTMGVYTHTQIHDLGGAVAGLPNLLPRPGTGAGILAATGTDAGAPGPRPDQNSAAGRQRLLTHENTSMGNTGRRERRQILDVKAVADDREGMRMVETEEAPPGFEPGLADLQSAALPLG